MKYDFETYHPRWGIGAYKWAQIENTKYGGSEIVPLSIADMELLTAPQVIEAAIRMAEFGMWGYTGATESYLDSVMDWMAHRHEWKIEKSWILPYSGIVPALYGAVRAFTQEGDNVILQTPVYYPFYLAVERNRRNVVENPLKIVNGRYEMDFEDLCKKAADKKTKLIFLCSPHNPVGRVWTREELTTLGDICIDNGVMVVSDEIHFDLVYPPNVHTVYANLGERFKQNSVIFTAASKTFSLAGLNCSNIIISNEQVRKTFYDQWIVDNGAFFSTTFGVVATEAAYRYGGEWCDELIEHLEGNYHFFRRFMEKNFPQIKVYDLEGTYLVWFDCSCFGLEPKELEKFMTEEAMLFLDEGYIFGDCGAGFERINIACPRKVLSDALDRLFTAAKRRGFIK